VLRFVAAFEAKRGGPGSVRLFEKNWLGLSYQLAAFRWVEPPVRGWPWALKRHRKSSGVLAQQAAGR
jgi:hypothetical protein